MQGLRPCLYKLPANSIPRIWVEVNSKKVNAKSIMGIISLGMDKMMRLPL